MISPSDAARIRLIIGDDEIRPHTFFDCGCWECHDIRIRNELRTKQRTTLEEQIKHLRHITQRKA